jgi:ribonuclease PH
MTGAGEFVELQATSERKTFDDQTLAAMLAVARKGLAEIFAAQRAVLSMR